MSRLSREEKRQQWHAARPVAPVDVRVMDAGTASVDGVPLVAAPGQEIQQVVLDHLHRLVLATGRPVRASVRDDRIGYVVPLQMNPDGSTTFTADPVPTADSDSGASPGPQATAPEAVPEPDADASPGSAPAVHGVPATDPAATAASTPPVPTPAPPSAPTAPPAAIASGDSAPAAGPLRAVPDAAPGTVQAPTGVFGPPPDMGARPHPVAVPAPDPAPPLPPTPPLPPAPPAPAVSAPERPRGARPVLDEEPTAGHPSDVREPGGDRSDGQPDGRSDGQPDGRSDGQPDGRSDGQPDGRSDGRSDHRRPGGGPEGVPPALSVIPLVGPRQPEPPVRPESSVPSEPALSSEPAVRSESSVPSEPAVRPEPALSSEPAVRPEPSVPSEPAVRPEPALSSEAHLRPEPTVRPEPSLRPEPSSFPGPPRPGSSRRGEAARRLTPDLVAAPEPEPAVRPTPARGFDAVAEAVLGDGPATVTKEGAELLGEPMTQINEAVRAGRIEAAAELARSTTEKASALLGADHPEVLRLTELTAYIAYLAGDPVRSFRLSLGLAGLRHRARDAEGAYGNVQSAAAAWRAVRDPGQGLALGHDLIALWAELAVEQGPAAHDLEQLDSARARMTRLTARAARATE